MNLHNSKIVYDKRGIEVCVGDVLKVFHFTGGRRKKYYMYKIAVIRDGYLLAADAVQLGKDYTAAINGACILDVLGSFEIVAGFGPKPFLSFEDRPRINPFPAPKPRVKNA